MTVQSPIDEGRSSRSVQIRMAAPGDAPQVAAVLRESFAEYRDLYTSEAFAATTPASEEVQSRMQEGPVWVALLDGMIIGTVAAVDRGEELYIRGMAVLASARGRDVGQLLLRQIEDYASAHGYRLLTLSTTPFLHRAIRLYERFGFRRSVEGTHDLFGTPLFTMVKQPVNGAQS